MRLKGLVLAAALALGTTAPAAAHTAQKGGLQVVHPWVGPARAGEMTQGHPTLVNTGDQPITIAGASCPVAESVALIHQGREVSRVTIPPGETLTPESFRLRLHGLKTDFPEGKAVPVRFRIEGASAMQFHMAIGQGTMNPDEVVEMPHHGTGSGRGSGHGGEHHDREGAHHD